MKQNYFFAIVGSIKLNCQYTRYFILKGQTNNIFIDVSCCIEAILSLVT